MARLTARGAEAVASVPLPVRAGRVAGFSLVELMVAMAIFSVLGVALIALLRSSTAFLEKGQAGSELQDQIENADRLLAEDFANVYIRSATMDGMPDVRFLCDRIPFDNDGDSIFDTKEARLSFVRSVRGEASDLLLRNSGTKAGATATIDGEEDMREAEDRDHRAPGGKQEVCWIYVPDGKDGDRGLGTLYRKTRMPVGGGPASLLPMELLRDKPTGEARDGIASRAEAQAQMRPVIPAVLHISFRFYTRHATESATRLVQSDRLLEEVPPNRGGGGLSPTWDSTRGLLPVGQGLDQFFLAKGPASLADPVDDIFPRRVRVTLVLDRVGSDAATAELTRPLGPQDSTIPVDNTRFAPGGDPAERFIKVGDEWIQWSSRDARGFIAEKRGARGTKAQSHAVGTKVRAGATLVREYEIPSFREDWNE